MTVRIRRKLIKALGTMPILVPAALILPSRRSESAELPPLDPSSRQARALEYVDRSRIRGQSCGDCRNFQGGAGNPRGPCAIVPGKTVSASGRCRSWTRR